MSERRNPYGGLMAEEPGGHEREAGATFGAGTLRPCEHRLVRRLTKRGWQRYGFPSGKPYGEPPQFPYSSYPMFIEDWVWGKTGDPLGTVRCAGCGIKRDA